MNLISLFFLVFSCVFSIHAANDSFSDLADPFFDFEPAQCGYDYQIDKVERIDRDICCAVGIIEKTTEEQATNDNEFILSADCEPLAVVGNCVNLISGNFFQVECDLNSTSIEPVEVIRAYDSGSKFESVVGFGFSTQFPLWASGQEIRDNRRYAMISEREGSFFLYRGSNRSAHKHLSIDPRLFKKGATNLSRGMIGGTTNLVNYQAVFSHKPSDGCWKVQLGDGSRRFYTKHVKLSDLERRRMDIPHKGAYLLTKEIKPNGNQILYSYSIVDNRTVISKITSMNRSGTAVLDEINFQYNNGSCVIQNKSGDSVKYSLKDTECVFIHAHGSEKKKRKTLNKVSSNQNGKTQFETVSDKKMRRVSRVNKPEGEFVEVRYHDDGGSKKKYKVHTVIEPRGANNQPIKTHRIAYGEKSAQVKNALGQEDQYLFDEHERLHEKKYIVGNTAIRTDSFSWNQEEFQRGWLKRKSVRQGFQKYHKTVYEYDTYGNVTKEILYGNITGQKNETFTSSSKTDRFVTETVYSQDGLNLPLEKKTPDGIITKYAYLPKTNLCTKELIAYNGKIQERHFFSYDINGQVVQVIEDDGSDTEPNNLTDVIARIKVDFETYQTANTPHYGKPKVKTISFWDPHSGNYHTQNRTEYAYDASGNEISKKFYDSKGVLHYEINKKYDTHRNIIEEIDPLGQQTHYTYDKANRLIRKKSTIGITTYRYDAVGRLIEREEEPVDEPSFVVQFEYNGIDQKISETDRFGNRTIFTYDRLGHLTKCIKPTIYTREGHYSSPTVTYQNNILGQPIEKTDENGNTTKTAYNIFGKPTRITHPDGAIEQFIYETTGTLKEHKNPDGTSIHYERDPKGRIIRQLTRDASGGIVKTESYVYKGKQLVSSTDPTGLKTTYEYDAFGKKIKEQTGNKRTEMTYDDFGRLVLEFHALQDSKGQYILRTYDQLDRVTSKTLQDEKGYCYSKTTYTYDLRGNLIETKASVEENVIAQIRSQYDASGAVLWEETPYGERTEWTYNYRHLNGINQQVRDSKKTDPLGRILLQVNDAFSRVVRSDLVDVKHLSSEHFDYDNVGNLIAHHSAVMDDGNRIRDYYVQWTYNPRGLVKTETEQPSGKTTKYHYDTCQRKIRQEKPDNVALQTTYDSLGRIKKIVSSNHTIETSYTYNLQDLPVEAIDHVRKMRVERSFDEFGRTIAEKSNCSVRMEYDTLDRLIRYTLPDESYIVYEYDSFHLIKILRYKDNKLQYTCTLDKYDLLGNVLEWTTPAGTTHAQYDLAGRPVELKKTGWSLTQNYDPVGNLIRLELQDPSGTETGTFRYDSFNHLSEEYFGKTNQFAYDSLGNCLSINQVPIQHNNQNQVTQDKYNTYQYDANGNLIQQSTTFHRYDALNRLIEIESNHRTTTLTYDPFDRCIQISDQTGTKDLFYQFDKEVGSLSNGKVHEFRLMDPQSERVFAIEIDGQPYFPVQDHRFHIAALYNSNGIPIQWTRYTAFDEETTQGDLSFENPWRFGNRRQIEGLSLFKHRFYHPKLMRWMTQDPLRFADGLNCYAYVHNNPFRFSDPDGRFAMAIPIAITLFEGTFGAALTFTCLPAIGTTAALIGAALAVNYVCNHYDLKISNSILPLQKLGNVFAKEDDSEVIEPTSTIDAQGKPKFQKPSAVRTEPENLMEDLTLKEAKNKPYDVEDEILTGKIKDPKYPIQDWAKMEHNHKIPEKLRCLNEGKKNIEIHYWQNRRTGEKHGFKFKDKKR